MDYDDLRAKALILQSRDLEIAEFHAMQLPLAVGLLALLDENKALRADAERYRFLRDDKARNVLTTPILGRVLKSGTIIGWDKGNPDAAIDRALDM